MARRRRHSLPVRIAADLGWLGVEAGAVVVQRVAMLARGGASSREAVRMVAEKPAAFAKAAAAAGATATAAMVRHPLNPLAAWGAATSAWARALTGTARANRKRLWRRG